MAAVALTVAFQMAVVYVPWLQGVFRTGALSAGQVVGCVGLALVVPAAVEVEKSLVRRGLLYGRSAS